MVTTVNSDVAIPMPENYGEEFRSSSCCCNIARIFSRTIGGASIIVGGVLGIAGVVLLSTKSSSPDWIEIGLVVVGVVMVAAGVLLLIKNPYLDIQKENNRLKLNNDNLQVNILALNQEVQTLQVVNGKIQVENAGFQDLIRQLKETIGNVRSVVKDTLSQLDIAKNELLQYQAMEKTLKEMLNELTPELVSQLKKFEVGKKAADEAAKRAQGKASEIMESQKQDLNHIQELVIQLIEFRKDVEALNQISINLTAKEKELEEDRDLIAAQTTIMGKNVEESSAIINREEKVTKDLDILIEKLSDHLKVLKKAKRIKLNPIEVLEE